MRAAKAQSNSSGRQEFRVRTFPLSAHLCGCAGCAPRTNLGGSSCRHDAALIGADDGIAAEHADVMAAKALGPPSVTSGLSGAKIVPIGMLCPCVGSIPRK